MGSLIGSAQAAGWSVHRAGVLLSSCLGHVALDRLLYRSASDWRSADGDRDAVSSKTGFRP